MSLTVLLVSCFGRRLGLLLLTCVVLAGPAWAEGPTALSTILNPDGTVRAGAQGSFDAKGYEVGTAPDGRPAFRPLAARRVRGTRGAGDAGWSDGFGLNGINGTVYALAVAGNTLYAGGYFATAGGVATTNVAKWDGTAWAALGTGIGTIFSDYVYALAVDASGNLYAGGSFSRAGGVAASRVAKWDGLAWSAMGTGFNGSVDALTVDSNGSVYAGGSFNTSFSIGNVSRWNGTAWTSTNGGFNGMVYALTADGNGNVYAGGSFSTAGSVTANRVARWNGTAWSALGTGIGTSTGSGIVYALAFDRGSNSLYAGGNFGAAGGAPANCVARWNGTAWGALGTGITNPSGSVMVNALAVDARGHVYASGTFSMAGTAAANAVAHWDGATWTALDAGLSGPVPTNRPATNIPVYGSALAVAANGDLYAGGDFMMAGSLVAHNVARWSATGAGWSRLGSLVNAGGTNQKGDIFALALDTNGDLYAAGSFAAIGDVAAMNIAKWNGTTWEPLGTGLGFSANTYTRVSHLALDGLGNLYAVGDFFVAGGVPVTRIAKWDGIAWSALDAGLNSSVTGLATNGAGTIYAAGYFTQAGSVPAAGIARWDGNAWSAVGTGIPRPGAASSVAADASGNVYVGGTFSFPAAGGGTITNIAKWNGTAWSALGTGTNGMVSRIAVAPNGTLYASGTFTAVGGQPAPSGVGRWDGTAWTGLPLPPDPIATTFGLAVDGSGNVYVGRGFGQGYGGTAAGAVTKWNGTAWTSLGTGTSGSVSALAPTAAGVYVGGGFWTVGDGSKVMNNLGYFSSPAVPFLTAISPGSGAVGSTLTLTGTGLTGAVVTFSGTSNNTVRTGFAVNAAGTQLTGLVVPAGAVSGPVMVTTPGGNSAAVSFTVTTATAAAAPVAPGGFQVFPNPARASATVRLPAVAATPEATLTLLDALGRPVLVRRVRLGAALTTTEIPLAGLAAGSYRVRVQAGALQSSQVLVVE
ncbi:PE family protein [Hymenobacter segetis]|uniref:T9SS type A sorting domain-containing protein n=1 Tax=Hymenobacter segetis TaxID=2025509 RepID=A0ABU9LV60_9BACT